MEKIQFKIEIKRNKDKQPIECVTQIIIEEDDEDDLVVYLFPPSLQPANAHTVLLKQSPIKAALKALNKNFGHYRTPRVLLGDEIRNTYFDECDNPTFMGELLEKKEKTEKSDDNFQDLLEAIREKKFRTKDADKEFNVKIFEGKTNVYEFLTTFEGECRRHEIADDEQKIDILRSFLKETALNWYEASRKKLEKDWQVWTESMKNVFGVVNFATVRSTYQFHYMAGKMVDYALKKENLILDLDENLPEATRIDMIVLGLPISVQDKLNRASLKDVDTLCKKLAELDQISGPSKQEKNVARRPLSNSKEKKPCSICEKLNKPERFHPESKCWFKDRKTNLISHEENFDNPEPDPKN